MSVTVGSTVMAYDNRGGHIGSNDMAMTTVTNRYQETTINNEANEAMEAKINPPHLVVKKGKGKGN